MFCWRVHVGQGKERTISCKSKGCGERVPAFVRQGARAEVVVPGAQDATGSTGGVNRVPRGEAFRQESFCFQGRGVLELKTFRAEVCWSLVSWRATKEGREERSSERTSSQRLA